MIRYRNDSFVPNGAIMSNADLKTPSDLASNATKSVKDALNGG